VNIWYEQLNKPSLTPPSWIFSPVWTVLYILIVIAIVRYYRTPEKQNVGIVTSILLFHVGANLIWTYLFFGLQSPLLALIDIILLDITLVMLVVFFAKASALAGGLLMPYLLWVLFATYLNWAFYRLN